MKTFLKRMGVIFGVLLVLGLGSSLLRGGNTAESTPSSVDAASVSAETMQAQNGADSGELETDPSEQYGGHGSEVADTDGDSLMSEGSEESDESTGTVNSQPGDGEELQVHYIDVGQGDSTLLVCGGQAMLIDAGNNNKGTTVQLYLQKQGITTLDYVVGTHPDADHIGGLDVIITKFDCGTIFMPDVSNDTNTYRDVLDAMKYKDYSVTVPGVGDTYTLGDATFTILAPNRNYTEMNNNSIAIRVEHGENTFLFVGDAAGESEADMMANGLPLQAQVLKVGHHGSSSSTSKAFLDAVHPEYAVISCGRDNSYGHPTAETLTTLREAGVHVFRTDEQGSIVVTSDGRELVFNQTPSTTWKAGTASPAEENTSTGSNAASATTSMTTDSATTSSTTTENGTAGGATENTQESQAGTSDATGYAYMLNTNTMKFHRPGCSSIQKMAEDNKQPSNQSREEIIAQGYEPCQICKP